MTTRLHFLPFELSFWYRLVGMRAKYIEARVELDSQAMTLNASVILSMTGM